MPIVIKQPSVYVNLAVDCYEYYEPYDHTLVQCDCGRLCEKGVDMCDPCIDEVTTEMTKDLDRIIK